MIGALALWALLGPPQDSLPRFTLDQALERAARLDPSYVQALGEVGSAEWARRSAITTFIVPAITVSSDYATFSTPIFNLGIGGLTRTSVTARADARLELFSGGRRLADLKRSGADLETARATADQMRFAAALDTEADFYGVLGSRDLVDVARDRLRRAQEQLVVARARVVSGAVVQTDSLQILLEVNRAQVALIREQARLTVTRLRFGRRVGVSGPADAVVADTGSPGPLPISREQAVAYAIAQGPEWRAARAGERAADATLAARKAAYLPQAALSANLSSFGDRFFPDGVSRSSLTLSVSFPLWDNFQRELNVSRARVARDAARAAREDLERAAHGDVIEAYEAFETARAAGDFAGQAVVVAQETFRVQQARYRAGASTILDLLDAQTALTEAQSELVQARYATRLALAGLEAILGARLNDLTALP